MSQITDQEVVFSSQYLVTLERSSNRHATAIINQEISELAGLVEEIQLSQDSEGSEGLEMMILKMQANYVLNYTTLRSLSAYI